ncbi:hypothetical protein DC366_04460 [Pelagivirga sediminicola]|uniref:Uncharacterized protein n=1 Tax=Pelagivirga sediminicola TaxID=2170575 RepID=A0A2T7G9D8_9RHOB|nr:hypothetical protein DC366_04460 [Pelagivirga sediminicola]
MRVYATVKTGGTLMTRSRGQISDRFTPDAVAGAAVQETPPPLHDWPRTAEITAVIEEADGIRSIWFCNSLAALGSLDVYEAAQHIRLQALDGRAVWRAYTISGVAHGSSCAARKSS